MPATASAPQASVNSYDELPYLDHTVAETSPDRLAAVATLYGMSPPDPRRCRVLEIGCATGANLWPMAVAMPGAQFVGIDLSQRQVESGRSIVATLGLENLTLRAMSLLDINDDFGLFDYIICHGVYSWVPAPARDKILEIFARNLTPDGVGYLSYNTYPGWHFRGMVRALFKYHSDGFPDPKTRVDQSRAILDFVAQSVPNTEGIYAQVLKDERKTLETMQDTYVFHEHLEEVNHPVYFHELAEAAAGHGLGYLGPARFDTIDDNLPGPVQQTLDALGTDRIRREQYLDFVRNRTFRKSLFCHADRARGDLPQVESLDRLRFSSQAKPESDRPDIRSDAPEEFRSPTDDRLTTPRPIVKAALTALFAAWPRSLSLDELWAEVRSLLGPAPDGDRRILAEVLLKAHVGNLVAIHTYEPPFAAAAGDRPIASIVARYQAESEAKICNLRHRVVKLDDFDSLVIRLLDGNRDRPAIVAALEQWAAEAVFEISHAGQPVQDEAQRRAALTECLDASLARLAKLALLVG
jgi:methyltransferase-like protein/cyclopropane fatty-acyl-phospholipid synthase-like methyltransferase